MNGIVEGDVLDPTIVLIVSAALSAILHTLVPDHVIPLAMIGRTQNWTLKKMGGVTLIAGVIHISVSMGIGAVALIASAALSRVIANSTQQISGLLLIAFGSIYVFVSWKRKKGVICILMDIPKQTILMKTSILNLNIRFPIKILKLVGVLGLWL